MVVYNCPRCGYSTGNKSYFRKHLLRKKVCKVVLNDIPVEKILQDIEVRKNNTNLKLEHLKKTPKKLENVTKNVTKPKIIKNNKVSGENNVTKNNRLPTNLRKKNVTKSHFSVSQQKVTFKPPETSCNQESRKNEDGTNLLKIWADAGDPKIVSVSQNVSQQKVTKKVPKTSINDDMENTNTALNLQAVWADADIHEKQCVSQNVSQQKVTFKAPETKLKSNVEKMTIGQNLQTIWADAKNTENNSVSQQKVTFKPPVTKSANLSYNYEVPEDLLNSTADAEMLQKNKSNKRKIRENYAKTSNEACYEKTASPDNLLFDEMNPSIISYLAENQYESGSLSDEEYKVNKHIYSNPPEYNNSNNYYNNFEAPPVMNATASHHHSPNKLYTTKINNHTKSHRRNYRPIRHYEEHSFDEEEHYCKYCGQIFKHRQSKWKHEKKCTKKNVLANKCSRLEQQNKEKDKAIEVLKAQMEIIMEKVGSQVHNHNTTNYTINVVLNAFGSETTDYLTGNKVRQILQQGGAIDSIPRLLKAIHFNPDHIENQNVIIPSRKDNVAKIWDGHKWVLKAKETTINEMTDKAYNLINEHYDEGNKQYDDFTDRYANNDKMVKKRVTQDTELMIINSAKKNSQKTITQS